jgi:hypothetical protein
VRSTSDIFADQVVLLLLLLLLPGPVMLQGPTMDPRIASELLMRLPHLHLRMAEHSRRAAAMAAALSDMGAKVRGRQALRTRGRGGGGCVSSTDLLWLRQHTAGVACCTKLSLVACCKPCCRG